MKQKLMVVGSVAFDDVKTRAGERKGLLGGAAVYISLAASHFTSVNLVGVVGEDDFPQTHVDLLNSKGVDTKGLSRAKGKTFRWSGVYADDFSSRRTLDTQLGVFESFDPRVPPSYAGAKFLLLGNINPELQLKILEEMGSDCFTATDTMNLWIETARDKLMEVMARTSLLIINDEESFLLTGEPQISKAAEKILGLGPESLIIKRGEHGAYLFAKETVFFAPAYPLDDVVDPTGAGDTFAGGLIGYLAGVGSSALPDIKKGMIYGTSVASATCQGFGTESVSSLTAKVIDERFAYLRRLVSLD